MDCGENVFGCPILPVYGYNQQQLALRTLGRSALCCKLAETLKDFHEA